VRGVRAPAHIFYDAGVAFVGSKGLHFPRGSLVDVPYIDVISTTDNDTLFSRVPADTIALRVG
jgi:hypothetical protein